ncbi:progesterone receptor [Octodon degus]|uniref:Progesterone receptor n=1 Tax=Octodon degus TaxID=10160 RepID=A0A6P6DZ43_OCTDE|nr:progesterone receptor [Octodon degus]
MTEAKAKDPRAPHAAGSARSPSEVGSPLRGRQDACAFRASQASQVASPGVSLDGLLFPRLGQGQEPPDSKAQERQPLLGVGVQGTYPGAEAAGGTGGGGAGAPEKDGALLDSVLDTLLEPSGPRRSRASPPACGALSPWCLFGPELPEDSRGVPAPRVVLSPLMSRPENKAGDGSGAGAASKMLTPAPPPSGPLLLPPAGGALWPGAAAKQPPQLAAAEVELDEDGSEPDALFPPLGLNGLPGLGYPAAVLKDGLPQVYPPYLNYLRPDSEASQSPQYSFESLPQKICLICGDEASGCHYGVLTCGSCKVFFKRAMEGQHNYLCAGRNDCIVDKIRRKNCPACRLRKCCQAGMVLGGRKFKKFNKVRVMRALDGVALPQPVGVPNESQRITFSPSQEIQLVPPLINLLLSIEPDVVYAGHDNTKPDTSSSLLTSLNQLGERQLLSVVKWSKSLPGFRSLHIDDQITLIQYSWMSLMVFALGWRSYKHVSGQMLYFAPDLILNEQRMKESSFYSLCLTMWQIPQEFVKLQVSEEEFLCMKVLLLLNTIPLEGLRSQSQFDEMRASYIRELAKAIGLRQKGVVSSSQRFYQLTKLLDSLHDLVKQLHLYCLNTFIQSRALAVEFPEMMSEVIAAQLPKILAGMVKPLLFHKK